MSNKSAEDLNQGKLKDEQLAQIKKLFQLALDDERISTKEIAEIQFFYYDSELTQEEFDSLKTGVFQEVVNDAIADHVVTEKEEKSIIRISKQLGISGEWKKWARRQIESTESSGKEE